MNRLINKSLHYVIRNGNTTRILKDGRKRYLVKGYSGQSTTVTVDEHANLSSYQDGWHFNFFQNGRFWSVGGLNMGPWKRGQLVVAANRTGGGIQALLPEYLK